MTRTLSRHRLLARWRALDEIWRDGLGALPLAIGSLIPAGSGIQWGTVPAHEPGTLALALALMQCLPLLARRRWPAGCLAVVAAGFCGYQMMGYPRTIGGLGLLVALYSVGAHQVRARRAVAAGATVAYAVASVAMRVAGSPERPWDYVTFYLLLAACWANGALVRAWRAGEAERLSHLADRAVAQERARIARDLHDVVTHHVTAMVIQADAAAVESGRVGQRREGLAAISDTGRQALAELRHLLDVLHPPADPAAGPIGGPAGDVAALVEGARRSGQPVELAVEGEPPGGGAAVSLAAYRVVQEGLTNAVKHAPGRPTVVRIRYGDKEMEVSVRTEGRGIEGLRERVGLLGGELSAVAGPDGGFALHASLPREGQA